MTREVDAEFQQSRSLLRVERASAPAVQILMAGVHGGRLALRVWYVAAFLPQIVSTLFLAYWAVKRSPSEPASRGWTIAGTRAHAYQVLPSFLSSLLQTLPPRSPRPVTPELPITDGLESNFRGVSAASDPAQHLPAPAFFRQYRANAAAKPPTQPKLPSSEGSPEEGQRPRHVASRNSRRSGMSGVQTSVAACRDGCRHRGAGRVRVMSTSLKDDATTPRRPINTAG